MSSNRVKNTNCDPSLSWNSSQHGKATHVAYATTWMDLENNLMNEKMPIPEVYIWKDNFKVHTYFFQNMYYPWTLWIPLIQHYFISKMSLKWQNKRWRTDKWLSGQRWGKWGESDYKQVTGKKCLWWAGDEILLYLECERHYRNLYLWGKPHIEIIKSKYNLWVHQCQFSGLDND